MQGGRLDRTGCRRECKEGLAPVQQVNGTAWPHALPSALTAVAAATGSASDSPPGSALSAWRSNIAGAGAAATAAHAAAATARAAAASKSASKTDAATAAHYGFRPQLSGASASAVAARAAASGAPARDRADRRPPPRESASGSQTGQHDRRNIAEVASRLAGGPWVCRCLPVCFRFLLILPFPLFITQF
jgi:hypothetical protein